MIPKSLHTVTVLVQFTRHLYDSRRDFELTIEHCLYKALDVLGYSTEPDAHGLALQALKKLRKG